MALLLTPWQSFVRVITHPFTLLQSTVEYLLAWFYSRRWFTLLLVSPALILLLSAGTLILLGIIQDRRTMAEKYVAWFEAESEALSSAEKSADEKIPSNPMLKEEKVDPYGLMLLRRVLQLEQTNPRATYLVGAQLSRQGKVGQARQMMRGLAPKSAKGFAPAHAWLAADQLTRRGVSNREETLELMHNLEIASSWDGSGAALRAAYAQVLEREGRIGEAIASLTEAVKIDPSLNVELANLAYRNNRKQPQEKAIESAKKVIEEKIKSESAVADDYAQLANILLLEQKADEAIARAEQGLAIDSGNAALKRLASEAFRLKYLQTIKNSAEGIQVNLGFLDAALKSDPTNPAVAEEIAKLSMIGQQATDELEAALNTQLANGQATAMTHILIANKNIVAGKLKEAIPHLKMALRQAPDNPKVLNNLALATATVSPDQIDQSLQWIEKAVSIQGNNPELHDTLGQILMLKGDELGAISSYEKAIGLDGNRVITRELMLAACEKAGMSELAEAQRTAIENLRANPK